MPSFSEPAAPRARRAGRRASVGLPSCAARKRPRVAILITGRRAHPGPASRSSPAASTAPTPSRSPRWSSAPARSSSPRPPCPTISRAPARRSARRSTSADVVIVSGGVSVGPHDHVKPALRELGVEERFWGVLLRPGKPTWFGTRGELLAFGLPGNPVSAMVTFQLFARPALAALQGAPPGGPPRRRRARRALARNPQREQAIRVRLRQGENGLPPTPTGAQGSHVLTSMLGADALALIPPARARPPPASAWRSSSCEVARPAPPRGPYAASRAPARPRAREHRPGAAVRLLARRRGRQPAGRRGDAAARRARADLDARVPGAARAHLLELPVALLARPDPRALQRGLARGGVPPRPVRPAPLPQARVRPRAGRRHRHLADQARRAGGEARPRPRLPAPQRPPPAAPRPAPARSPCSSRPRS